MQRRKPQLIFTGSVLCGPPWTRGDGGLGRSYLWALCHHLPLSLRRLLGERFLSPPAVCWGLCSAASGHSSGLSRLLSAVWRWLIPHGASYDPHCSQLAPLVSVLSFFVCETRTQGAGICGYLYESRTALTFPGQPWRAMALLWLVCLTACLFHLPTCRILTHQFSGAFLVLYNSIIHLPTTV